MAHIQIEGISELIQMQKSFGENVSQLQEMIKAIGQQTSPISFSEEDAAAELGISAEVLSRIRYAGKIKFTRCGRKPRYLPEHIKEYLKNNERQERKR